jgi:tetratricopeptide (TPR) repeat protein
MVYRLKGDSDHAIADYTQAIVINPRSAIAYFNRGSIFETKGERERAIADFSKAIGLAPRDAEAYVRRGVIYQATGDSDRAIADYSKAIEIDPRQAEAYVRRGIVYRMNGDGDSAISDYDKASNSGNQEPGCNTSTRNRCANRSRYISKRPTLTGNSALPPLPRGRSESVSSCQRLLSLFCQHAAS